MSNVASYIKQMADFFFFDSLSHCAGILCNSAGVLLFSSVFWSVWKIVSFLPKRSKFMVRHNLLSVKCSRRY